MSRIDYGLRAALRTGEAAARRMLIPAYIYPSAGSGWDDIIARSRGVGIVVANIDSGASTDVNSDYAAVIERAKAVGVDVYIYVPTNYAATPVADVKGHMDDYVGWYDPAGFFIDQSSPTVDDLAYYAEIYAHAGDRGVVLNFGAFPAEELMAACDIAVVYENGVAPAPGAALPAWADAYPQDRFCVIAYNEADLTNLDAVMAAGWVYVSDANGFGALPSYYDDEREALIARSEPWVDRWLNESGARAYGERARIGL